MKTVYENLKEMLELAEECYRNAKPEKKEFWLGEISKAKAELTKYA